MRVSFRVDVLSTVSLVRPSLSHITLHRFEELDVVPRVGDFLNVSLGLHRTELRADRASDGPLFGFYRPRIEEVIWNPPTPGSREGVWGVDVHAKIDAREAVNRALADGFVGEYEGWRVSAYHI
jgi:hypothetical protein